MYELTYFLAGLFIGALVCFVVMLRWHGKKIRQITRGFLIMSALEDANRKSGLSLTEAFKKWDTFSMPNIKQ